MYQEEGSDSGTLVRFINRIAEAIEEDYPDLTVVTLAYMRTEKPPKVTKMRDNVAIQYCTHFACYQHAINDPECDEYGGLWGYYFNISPAARSCRMGQDLQNPCMYGNTDRFSAITMRISPRLTSFGRTANFMRKIM